MESTCVLSEMSTSPLLSEETLIATRWSLGQEGDVPWSTSFYFRPDGRIGGYKSPNEVHWSYKGSVLRIFDLDKREMWRFENFDTTDGKLRAVGSFQREPNVNSVCILTEMPALASSTVQRAAPVAPSAVEAPAAKAAKIKLLIWDLDDTLWSGTLAEGGIEERPAVTAVVRTLASRGILNSICSKNDYEQAKARLVALGIWDYFVFPKIKFAPKGMMIRDIIELCQLLAASVLFIEDNPVNINEARHYNPDLQVCGPEDIESLLDDKRCRGKPDPKLERLSRYKVLEQKDLDRKSTNPANIDSENIDFLRQSEICISFHEDVEAEFSRIHDLVNRTNQLNFTKNRWPENEAEALAVFRRELGAEFDSQFGYVKVSDRYGQYGICGFFLIRNGDCHHFTFSCRALNMGIEQFVWQRLGRPYVPIRGEVVSSLGDAPDWITVVEDADFSRETIEPVNDVSICVRGACDLAMMTHYLRMRFRTIEEFTFPYVGWGIHSCARAVALHDDLALPANRNLIGKLPGLPARRFESALNTGQSDVYVLSFSSEFFGGLYRSKTTDMILPLDFMPMATLPAWKKDFQAVDYESIKSDPLGGNISRAEWQMLQSELEYIGGFQEGIFRQDVRTIFSRLRGKLVIVLMLNTEIGADRWILSGFATVNNIVRPLTEEFGFERLEMSDFVQSTDDLVDPKDGGVHFSRAVYRNLSNKIAEIIAARSEAPALAALPA